MTAPWQEHESKRAVEITVFVRQIFDYIDKVRHRTYGTNQWIESSKGSFRFYLRFFNPPGYPRPRLELANLVISPRHKGIFTIILERLEKHGTFIGYDIFVENILSLRFNRFFLRRGYVPVKYRDYCLILYTIKEEDTPYEELPNFLTKK